MKNVFEKNIMNNNLETEKTESEVELLNLDLKTESEFKITYLKEVGFEINRPTIVRFSNHSNSLERNNYIEACLNDYDEISFHHYNVLDVKNLKFKDLDNAFNEIQKVVLQIEESQGVDVLGIEPPYTTDYRLYHLMEQLRLTGENLFLLRPIIQGRENFKGRDVLINGYEIFKPSFDSFLYAYEEKELEKFEKGVENEARKLGFLRLSRHEVYEAGMEQLKNILGENFIVREIPSDIEFEDADELLALIHHNIELAERESLEIKVIELIVPPNLLAEVLYKGDFKERGIKLIRPSFKKDDANSFIKTSTEKTRGRERFIFDSYKEVKPSNDRLSFFEANKNFNLNFEKKIGKLKSVEIENNGNENLNVKEYRIYLEKVLHLMSEEKWPMAFELLEWVSENLLSGIGIKPKIFTRKINGFNDFKGEEKSLVKKIGDKFMVFLEKFEMDDGYLDILKKKGLDTDKIKQGLLIKNIFTFVEELLHVLQYFSDDSYLLSSVGEMLYVNPYLNGREIYQRKRNELLPINNISLACEHDILCVYADFNISVPPLVWYGYQRFDLLELTLGKDYKNIKIKLADIIKIDNFGVMEIDDSVLADLLKINGVYLNNSGLHAILKRKGANYFLSYPDDMNDWSGWGIFYKDQSGFWQLLNEKEIDLSKHKQIRFGSAIEMIM